MKFQKKIKSALWWMRAALVARGLAIGLFVAAGAVFIALVAAKLVLPTFSWPLVLWGAVAMTALVCIMIYFINRPTLARAAVRVDTMHGTRERFVTALHARKLEGRFRDAILADAERFAENINPRRTADWRVQRPAAGATLTACAAAGIFYFMPEMDLLRSKAQNQAKIATQQAVQQQAKKLDELEKKLAEPKKDGLPSEASKRVAKDIGELQRQFGKGQAPTARDAMAKLSSLSDKIKQEKEKLKEKSSAMVGDGKKAPEPAKQTARLERALKRGDVADAKAELNRLQQQAAGNGRAAEDNQRLGNELSQLGESVEGQAKLSAGLKNAGGALGKPDVPASKAGFDEARAALDDIAAMQDEMQKLEQALTELENAKQQMASAAAKEGQSGESGMLGESGSCQGLGGPKQAAKQGKGEGSQGGKGGDKEGTAGGEQGGQQGSGGQQAGEKGEGEQGSQGGGQQGQQGSSFTVGSGSSSKKGQSQQGKAGQAGGEQGSQGEGGQQGEGQQGSQSGEGQEGGQSGGQQGGEGGQQGSQQANGSQQGGGSQSGSSSSSGNSTSGKDGNGGSPDYGVGTTNLATEGGYKAQPKAGMSRQQAGRDSNWTEEFVKLYDARSIANKQHSEQAKGKIGEGKFDFSIDVEGEAAREAPKVETSKAFMDYREAQKDSLAKEDIPLGYKEFVKNYFDSIEPPKK